jgi:hypothetical protein
LAGERDAEILDTVDGPDAVEGEVERRGLRRGPAAVAPALNMKLSSLRRPWKVGAGWESSVVSDVMVMIAM